MSLYSRCIFATFSSTVVPTSTPRWGAPALKGASNFTPNQAPNSSEFAIALHTRARGARSRTCFSIRSVVFTVLICNLWVAIIHGRPALCNLWVADVPEHQNTGSGRATELDPGGFAPADPATPSLAGTPRSPLRAGGRARGAPPSFLGSPGTKTKI